MSDDFAGFWKFIVAAQTEPALQEQDRREGAGNQQSVIEPRMKKNDVAMRLDQPAIGRVKQAANQTKRIEHISKAPHSNAKMSRPKPNPSSNFSKKTFEKITEGKIPHPKGHCPAWTKTRIRPAPDAAKRTESDTRIPKPAKPPTPESSRIFVRTRTHLIIREMRSRWVTTRNHVGRNL